MTKFRLAIIAAAFTLLIALAGYNWYQTLHHQKYSASTRDPAVTIGGKFQLVDQDGKAITEQALKGKWSVVFFGYTYCPDVCPVTLQSLAHTQKLLGDRAKDLQIVFITVDPARDTPANLKAYLASGGFPADVIGLSGAQDQIDRVEKAYRVTATKVGDGDTYSFNHTSVIYLMNPKGEFELPLTGDLDPKQSAKLIKDAMDGK